MFLPATIHPSWHNFLTEDIRQELINIHKQICGDYNPQDKHLVLRFLSLDLESIKVIWLGQDVYPAKGVATGRAFEAGNIESWLVPFKQVSLKNILRLIHKTYNHIEDYDAILSYTDIKTEIKNQNFKILPYKAWFNALEAQGVLLLNTSFTCAVGQANSHKALWANFSRALLLYISAHNDHLSWFLWGKEASKYKDLLQGRLYQSRHPMMCSKKYDEDFLKSDCFQATMDEIQWLGQ